MPIEVFEITDAQVQEILSLPEGHFHDIKAKEIKPSKLTRTISAFANADGGEFYVGIQEGDTHPHRWKGFFKPEDANAHVQVLENLFPLGEDYIYSFLWNSNNTGYVLQVVVKKAKSVVKANDDIPYIRRGAQNLPVDTPKKYEILKRNKGITTFETEGVPTDLTNVTNSNTVIDFMLRVVPFSEPEDWLKKQELIREEKPTVAGVVLFADVPQAILPKRTGMKIYRYKTSASEGNRETLVETPMSIEGCAYDIIKEAVGKTTEIISNIQVMGPKGLEPVVYPQEALHEVITNAILHRDYSIADDVHVRVFDNRVEVESPGRFPAHITSKNILKERFARNGNIVRIINKFPDPPNKDVGEGLNTAFEAMRNLRLKEPIFLEPENAVVVVIRHEKLASAEDIIMEYLQNNDRITNRVAREMTGIQSENSMKNVFWRLRKKSLIEMVPGLSGFSSAWQKNELGEEEW